MRCALYALSHGVKVLLLYFLRHWLENTDKAFYAHHPPTPETEQKIKAKKDKSARFGPRI